MSEETASRVGCRPVFAVVVVAAVILVVIVLAMAVWHRFALDEAREEAGRETVEQAERYEALAAGVERAAIDQALDLLRLAAVPLAEAVRPAGIGEDDAGQRELLRRLVKLRPVTRIAVVDGDGLIRMATDLKLEGEPASHFFERLPEIDGGSAIRELDDETVELQVEIRTAEGPAGRVIVSLSRSDLLARFGEIAAR